MKLIFESACTRWEAINKYGESAMYLPKGAGFKWDAGATRWHSTDALAALKLRDYADAATQARLDEVAAVARPPPILRPLPPRLQLSRAV